MGMLEDLMNSLLGGLDIANEENPQTYYAYYARLNAARQATSPQWKAKKQYESSLEKGLIIEGEVVKEEPPLLEDQSNGTKI